VLAPELVLTNVDLAEYPDSGPDVDTYILPAPKDLVEVPIVAPCHINTNSKSVVALYGCIVYATDTSLLL
jgi:hypothetical protein